MTVLDATTETNTALALAALLDAQRASFMHRAPSYRERMAALSALRDAIRARQDELVRAVSEDFGGRARAETLMLELFPLYDQIRHARRHAGLRTAA